MLDNTICQNAESEILTRLQRQPAGPSSESAVTTPEPLVLRLHDEPMAFNFSLFVFDNLQIPRGLFDDDDDDEVTFRNIEDCREYCDLFVEREKAKRLQNPPTADRTQEMRKVLNKAEMFAQTGTDLSPILRTGNPTFDAHLDDLRLDIYANVMFLGAPAWERHCCSIYSRFPLSLGGGQNLKPCLM